MMPSATFSSSNQLLAPSIALGLSCGIGYFLAQKGFKRVKWETTFRVLSRQIVNPTIPWWLLFLGQQAVVPLTVWWICKQIGDDSVQGLSRKDESDSGLGTPQNDSSLHSPSTKDVGVETTIPTKSLAPEPHAFNLEERMGNFDFSALEQVVTSPELQLKACHEPQRYLELLIHNISHKDLVLSLDTGDNGEYCLCRPRFSAFDLYSRRILASLPEKYPDIVSFRRYERSHATPRFHIVTPRPSRQKQIPTGLKLPSGDERLCVPCSELSNLRVRGRDAPRIEPFCGISANESMVHIDHVFFPLLATLLPRWYHQMTLKYGNSTRDVKKVLMLVSGVGTPRNWTHSITGNSTEACGQLMKKFIPLLYPDVTIVLIHSQTNLFRYDENIIFAKEELVPQIDAYRDAHAKNLPYPDEVDCATLTFVGDEDSPFSSDWKKSFHVTMSFADGTPARTHAIQISLRPYRPDFLHFWQLQSFWHDTKIVDDDIEMHSFEDMETIPAMEASAVADEETKSVIAEMNAFRNEFLKLLDGRNDVCQFWLRKTKKPVLAVLLVRSPNKPAILYRGTNMEVSMPTGSLCAERNVIGTALASNPGLKREDLRMVAVLAVPLPNVEDVLTRPTNMSRNMSFASYSSVVNNEDEDWIIGEREEEISTEQQANIVTNRKSPQLGPVLGQPVPGFQLPAHSSAEASPPGTPIRRIHLYSQTRDTTSKPVMGGIRKPKRTILVHSAKDLNPLKPCGACNEWLKKIAESNPYFKVVTFTDAGCSGVYICPCQQ
jgi:cytidine deaminase